MIRIAWLLVAICLAVAPGTARSDQRDPQLNGLFDRLKATTDPVEARSIESSIWQIWMTSDSAEVNKLMADGVQAMASGDFAEAFKTFDRTVDAAPDFAEGWNKRATVLYLMGEYAASMADVDRTLALEPRHFGALSGLGLIDVELDRDDDALEAFQRALAINPHMPGVLHNVEEARKRIQDRQI